MATSVKQQIRAIEKSVELMDAAAPAVIGEASPGDVVRQGDLYLVCLDGTPEGKVIKSRQLAPGTTQGSRHIAEGDCELRDTDKLAVAAAVNRLVRGAAVPGELVGPAIVCKGETNITHPEHGHRMLPADSSWACIYQRAYADEIRRVQD